VSDDRESLVGLRTESLLPSPYLIDVICALPTCIDGRPRHHRGPRRVGDPRKRERAAANRAASLLLGTMAFPVRATTMQTAAA